jgi:hypothetical protein
VVLPVPRSSGDDDKAPGERSFDSQVLQVTRSRADRRLILATDQDSLSRRLFVFPISSEIQTGCAVQHERPPFVRATHRTILGEGFLPGLEFRLGESRWRIRKSHGSDAELETNMAGAQVINRATKEDSPISASTHVLTGNKAGDLNASVAPVFCIPRSRSLKRRWQEWQIYRLRSATSTSQWVRLPRQKRPCCRIEAAETEMSSAKRRAQASLWLAAILAPTIARRVMFAHWYMQTLDFSVIHRFDGKTLVFFAKFA